MGIPIYETDSAADYYENDGDSSTSSCSSSASCSCSCSCSSTTTTTTTTTKTTTTAANNNTSVKNFPKPNFAQTENLNTKTPNTTKKSPIKNLVGNSKEFRIEYNRSDLRIVGNGNRITIATNYGNLQVIGDDTRLKIVNNNGRIRYTGNDGRICLGNESTQKAVDYIGCNGILKVRTTTELRAKPKCDHKPTGCENDTPTKTTTTKSITTPPPQSRKVKVKSASFGGNNLPWQQLSSNLNLHNLVNISMPNLKAHSYLANCCCSSKRNQQNIVQNIGTIIINNSVNVSL